MATLTHKGWFGICPVYFADLGSGAPLVMERHWLLQPLMMASELFFATVFMLAILLDKDFSPEWPLVVTGELDPPRDLHTGIAGDDA